MIPTPENAPPGTEIVCTRDKTSNIFFGGARLHKGTIYTIRAHILSVPCRQPSLLLKEIVNPPSPLGDEWCYNAPIFRLLHPLTNADHDFWKAPYPIALETL